MPKRSSTDINQIAARIVDQSTVPALQGKNPAAMMLGRLGGLRGDPARAQALSAAQRKRIAKKNGCYALEKGQANLNSQRYCADESVIVQTEIGQNIASNQSE